MRELLHGFNIVPIHIQSTHITSIDCPKCNNQTKVGTGEIRTLDLLLTRQAL